MSVVVHQIFNQLCFLANLIYILNILGTAWSAVLKRTDTYDESLFNELSQAYKEKYNFEWVGMYGFNNTYGIGVRNEIAQTYGVKRILILLV